jgi:ligand-binding sensor domain-containing protein/serine phosphatase RsbU (regulator of sigma subunit)
MIRTIVLFFNLFIFAHLIAQKEDLQFEHLSMKDGLSMNPVMAIIQDQQGFLWFGTQDGLNKYDGYTFKVYKTEDADPTSISDNFITSLCVDRKKRLWIGTLSGLNLYDPAKGTFKRFTQTGANFPNKKVYCLYSDPSSGSDGLIWVGTENGISLFDPGTMQFVNLKDKFPYMSVMEQKSVLCIYRERSGMYWFGTTSGLVRFDPSSNSLQNYFSNTGKDGSLSNNIVLSIFQDSKENMWFGTLEGLNRYNRMTNTFSQQYFKKSSEDLASTKKNNAVAGVNIYSIVNNYGGNTIRCILEDTDGWLWVGTDMELVIFNPASGNFINYKKDLINPTGINDHFIRSMYVDHSLNIWVGTLGNGLNKVNLKQKKFSHYQKKVNNPQSLSENYVRSICEDNSGMLWIGTLVGGLNRFDPGRQTFTHFLKGNSSSENNINDNNVWSICFDPLINGLWVGTNNGLDLYDLSTKKFTHFVHYESDPTSISDNTIRTVFIDSKQNVWCGTENGLNLFDRETKKFSYYNKLNSKISNNTVWKIAEDKAGKLWLATNEGLNCFDPATGKFDVFKQKPGDTTSLSQNGVRTVYIEKSGDIWIGTQNGLCKLDPEKLIFQRYDEKDGLPNPFIYAIIEDEKGHLWISTNKGISEFDKEFSFKNYDIYDGLQDYEFNTNASYRAKNGDIYFGGPNGFNRFNPSSLKKNGFIPPVVITSLKIMDKPWKALNDVSEVKEIELNYDENIIHIEFSSLDYTNASRNQYMYKMEGFNADWVKAGNTRFISYTNLDPGKYTFLVKGSNADGIWNEEPTKIFVNIKPPFWKTWWFYISCFLTSVLLVVMYIHQRTRNLIQAKATLEETVKHRTEEVEMQKNELAQKNKDITDSINYAQRIQRSILADENVFNQSFSDAFVLYRPRNIVSGDFYWITGVHTTDERNLNLKIVCAVDCTGHGVPGAFMSLIASEILGQTIKDKDINSPGDVLQYLNKRVPVALNKNNSEKIFDGMDVCCCAIDLNNNVLYFAGANRPLWIIKKDGTFEELKATKASVGGFTDSAQVFENKAFRFEKGDKIFLFSDGYADQFGGDKNKKIGTKKFRELIQNTSSEKMNDQKEKLIDFLVKWQDNYEQVDDVMVIGIKL